MYKLPQKIVCILHVSCFPGSAEKPLIAARRCGLQCSEISARRSDEVLNQTAWLQCAFGAQIFRALRALFRIVFKKSLNEKSLNEKKSLWQVISLYEKSLRQSLRKSLRNSERKVLKKVIHCVSVSDVSSEKSLTPQTSLRKVFLKVIRQSLYEKSLRRS